jgi:hypothetical protein
MTRVPLRGDARDRIRTGEPLREWTLNPSPLAGLGNPRAERAFREEISRTLALSPGNEDTFAGPWEEAG